MRLLRALLLFELGFWTGTVASALLMKRAFRGGSMLSWLGGIAADLREAQLATEAHLDVYSTFGGIAIRVPPGWRIESGVKSLGGGGAVNAPAPNADHAPTLRLDRYSAFGGIAIGAKSSS